MICGHCGKRNPVYQSIEEQSLKADDERRLGTFTVSSTHLENAFGRSEVRKLLKDIIIVEAHYDFASRDIKYVGIHWRFDIVPPGSMAKRYEILERSERIGDHTFTRLSWREKQERRERELTQGRELEL